MLVDGEPVPSRNLAGDDPFGLVTVWVRADLGATLSRHDAEGATFYELLAAGRGPRVMKVGKRTLISVEAAAEWRRKME